MTFNIIKSYVISSAQSLSHFQFFVTPWMQHARLPCSAPTPGACSNLCPLSQWCHPTISSAIIPFSCLQSFPASGSLQRSWLFASGGQSTGASASAPVFPINSEINPEINSEFILFRIDWFDHLAVQGTFKSLLQNYSSIALILWCSAFFMVQSSHLISHDYWKNDSFD